MLPKRVQVGVTLRERGNLVCGYDLAGEAGAGEFIQLRRRGFNVGPIRPSLVHPSMKFVHRPDVAMLSAALPLRRSSFAGRSSSRGSSACMPRIEVDGQCLTVSKIRVAARLSLHLTTISIRFLLIALPEEGAADLLQQRQWTGRFVSLGQNHDVFHYDFSSQIKRAQNWEWDDVVHVDSHRPITRATRWNSQSQEMSQTIDISNTSHLVTNSSVNVGLSLHG